MDAGNFDIVRKMRILESKFHHHPITILICRPLEICVVNGWCPQVKFDFKVEIIILVIGREKREL